MDRMPSQAKSIELNILQSRLVGDSQQPNLFFVKVGSDTQLVTMDFNQAYQFWKGLSRTQKTKEPSLADRIYGVICSVEKGLDPTFPHGYTTMDYSKEFMKTFLF